jgi:tRNA(fMet)-specific endonuclease VapC
LLARVRLWPLEREVAPEYGDVFRELRSHGRVLSQVDMMLAALARRMDLTLVTTDHDFDALPDLRTENWLNP